ncbi:AbrB/MazE/SpoVT family DNA-binding domain-containing protein [Rhizobium sp. P32RR-XVIII]|uniref:AbrB/MazE/SpoVT family DNA-binding domain-containing protein n=1 Tax=Rhizobium sp. P32RR-XVIII TaxID=2726738 RepID=UPI00145694AD|nr:AbrB/MazE/SpoVT family DNA-binding domain-containing protein [Rhizobium sp. P32RR-XVIII]NLS02571.1 AbrB/MazE/SpoVT family DNA-binding domain-containing protein [Rhizobium sp. P32RR-XVIII]
MQVAKWGNSLAVRIPTVVVDALELKEGDDVTIRIAEDRVFEIARNDARRKAFERIKAFKLKLPPDWKFDRDEANDR